MLRLRDSDEKDDLSPGSLAERISLTNEDHGWGTHYNTSQVKSGDKGGHSHSSLGAETGKGHFRPELEA